MHGWICGTLRVDPQGSTSPRLAEPRTYQFALGALAKQNNTNENKTLRDRKSLANHHKHDSQAAQSKYAR